MSSPTGGGQRNIWLLHTFPTTTTGTLSVWWYDTLGNLYSGLYGFNSATGVQISLGVYDNSAPYYVWNAGTPTYTTVSRTVGWHQLTIDVTTTGLTALSDGTQVLFSLDRSATWSFWISGRQSDHAVLANEGLSGTLITHLLLPCSMA
jgi:hypothetical protein